MSNIRTIKNIEYLDYRRCRISGLSKVPNIRGLKMSNIKEDDTSRKLYLIALKAFDIV